MKKGLHTLIMLLLAIGLSGCHSGQTKTYRLDMQVGSVEYAIKHADDQVTAIEITWNIQYEAAGIADKNEARALDEKM